MSLNSNVFIPMNIPVTQRAYLLGHTVEVNEHFYSHMRTESLSKVKDILNKGVSPSPQAIHPYTPTNLIEFLTKEKSQSQ